MKILDIKETELKGSFYNNFGKEVKGLLVKVGRGDGFIYTMTYEQTDCDFPDKYTVVYNGDKYIAISDSYLAKRQHKIDYELTSQVLKNYINRKKHNAKYWKKHREIISEKRKKLYEDEDIRKKILDRNKQWFKDNREKWNAYQRAYKRAHRKLKREGK